MAFGSQAIGMKNLSFHVKSVPNTARNEAISLSKSPISNTAIPKPVTQTAKVLGIKVFIQYQNTKRHTSFQGQVSQVTFQ